MRAPANTTTTRGPALGSPPLARAQVCRSWWLATACQFRDLSELVSNSSSGFSFTGQQVDKETQPQSEAGSHGSETKFLQENSEQGLFTIKTIQKC